MRLTTFLPSLCVANQNSSLLVKRYKCILHKKERVTIFFATNEKSLNRMQSIWCIPLKFEVLSGFIYFCALCEAEIVLFYAASHFETKQLLRKQGRRGLKMISQEYWCQYAHLQYSSYYHYRSSILKLSKMIFCAKRNECHRWFNGIDSIYIPTANSFFVVCIERNQFDIIEMTIKDKINRKNIVYYWIAR